MSKGVDTQMGALLRADTVAPKTPRSSGQGPAGTSFSSVLDSQNRPPQAVSGERSESGKRLPPRQGDAAEAAPGSAPATSAEVAAGEAGGQTDAADEAASGAVASASQPSTASFTSPSASAFSGPRSGAVLSPEAVGEGRFSLTAARGGAEAAVLAPGSQEEGSASAQRRLSTPVPGVGGASAGVDAAAADPLPGRSTPRSSDGELADPARGPAPAPRGPGSTDRTAAAALPTGGGAESAAARPGVVPAAPVMPDGLRRAPGGSAGVAGAAPGVAQTSENPAPGSRAPVPGDLALASAGSDAEPGRGESDRGILPPSAPLRSLSLAPEAPTSFSTSGAGLAASPSAGTGGALTGAAPASHDLLLRHAPADPEFGPEVAARMQTLIRDGVREARLQLHPAELGRLQVTVSTEGDQARVMFLADTAAARDAIEQALPRLRDALQQAGLQLAHSDVGQRQYAGGQEAGDGAGQQGFAGAGAQGASQDTVGDPAGMPPPHPVHDGRIDTFI